MAEKPQSAGQDPMIELTERARTISQDASGKVGSAMRDVIGAAAGIAGFAVESARDLLQYMVRRGQMSQDEADKLIREAEAVHAKRPKAERERLAAVKLAADKAAADKKAARLAAETALPAHRPLSKTVKTPPPLAKPGSPEATKAAEKPAAKIAEKPAAKVAAKVAAPAKPVSPAKSTAPAKAAASAKAVAKTPAKTAPAKKAAKSAAKSPPKKSVKKR